MFRPRLVDVYLLHAENVHVQFGNSRSQGLHRRGELLVRACPDHGLSVEEIEGSDPHKERRYPARGADPDLPARGLLIAVASRCSPRIEPTECAPMRVGPGRPHDDDAQRRE